MSRLEENEKRMSLKGAKHHSLVFECDGNDGDYLRIAYDEYYDDFRYMWIEVSPPKGLIHKLRYCFSILFGRNTQRMAPGIILNKESLNNLRDFFNEI